MASSSSAHRRTAVIVLLAGSLLAAAVPAAADFPTPGGAPGATTGDGRAPFTGLAEVPQAAIFSGAAVTSIRIELPPGRAGVTPRVDLTYSSAGGPSPYGYGWSLPLARVVRSIKHGVPRYDASDTFVLETAGASIEIEPVAGTKRYQARVESAFLRIGFDAATNSWRVIDKSGTTLVLGASAASRSGPDPAEPDGTYAWLVERSIDSRGNHVDFHYVPDTSGLPFRIDYGGNLHAGIAHLFSVQFAWTQQTYPTTTRVSYDAGYEQRFDRLLASITTHVGEEAVRYYRLSHEQDSASGAVRLVGVSMDGYAADPDLDVAVPSTVFSYTQAVQAGWPIAPTSERRNLATRFPSPGALRQIGGSVRFDTLDLNGDAIADFVDVRSIPAMVRFGTGSGFTAPVEWPWPSAPRLIRHIDSSNSNLDINVFDITGDGLPDLVDARSGGCQSRRWCVYRNTGSGFALSPTLWPAPRNDIRHAHDGGDEVLIDVADLDGDGRPDWIDATSYESSFPYWNVRWNTGAGFSEADYWFRAPRKVISRVEDGASRNHLTKALFDMNGDSLPDFVIADPPATPAGLRDSWDVYLNTGRGFTATPIEWKIEGDTVLKLSPYINETDGNDDRSETFKDLIDMTGDGLPDWVRFWSAGDGLDGYPPPECSREPACTNEGTLLPPECCFSLLVFVNTGASFSAPVAWPAWHDFRLRDYRDETNTSDRQFDLFDADGDGLVDLVEIAADEWAVFRHPGSPLAISSMTPLERRGRPNLLLSMMNGVGGETHLSYVPASLHPDSRIPFPYWTVATRQVRDSVASVSAAFDEYAYRGGLWDTEAREFRGFRFVEQTDVVGRTAASEFHQDWRRQGLLVSKTALDRSGNRLRVDENQWSESGPVLLTSRTSTPYYEDTAIPELAKQVDYTYDAYGNAIRETLSSPSATTVTTETLFAHRVADGSNGMPAAYLVDKPVHVSTSESSDVYLTEATYQYDTDPPKLGLVTAASKCIDLTSTGCERWQTVRYKHDSAGNITAIVGAAGGRTQQTYDSSLLYSVRSLNAAGLVTRSERDRRTGRETMRIEANGTAVQTEYDGLGRPVTSWRSGSSDGEPEVVTAYVDAIPGVRPGRIVSQQIGTAPVALFFDGLGRELASKTIVETVSGNRTVVDGLKVYDDAGRVSRQAVRFEAPQAAVDVLAATPVHAPAWTSFVYDGDGRLAETVLPDSSRILHDTSAPGVTTTIHANLASGSYPGKAVIELRDGLDRVWRKDLCSGTPLADEPGQCPSGRLAGRTTYVYDGLDRVRVIATGADTANPAFTIITYDGLGNRTAMSSTDLGTWRYQYDDRGLLVRATDPRGEVMRNSYDSVGRLRKQLANGFKAKYVYHRRGGSAGLVRRIRSKSGRASVGKDFDYDARGRVSQEQLRIRAGGKARRQETYYGYDDADRRTTVTYPSGITRGFRTVETRFSPYGRAVALVAFDPDGSETPMVESADYDIDGNLVSIVYGNGLRDVSVFAPAAELSRLECMRTTASLGDSASCSAAPSDLRRSAVEARDAAGNVLAIDDRLHLPGSMLDRDRAFAYDALGRLIEATYGATASESFAFDPHGNLLARESGSYGYMVDAPHRPFVALGADTTHDAAGNRTGKGPWGYAYDPMGRLTEVRNDGALRQVNFYDEGRTRVAREDAASGALRYYFAGLFEVEGETLLRHYSFGGRIVASDSIAAPGHLVLAGLAAPTERFPPATLVSNAPAYAATDLILAGLLLSFSLAAACGPRRGTVALVTALAFVVAATPLPASMQAQSVPRPRAAILATDTQFFYHADHLGSVELITDQDGTIVEQRDYDAYGVVRARFDGNGSAVHAGIVDLAYTGQTADEASGLVYFGSRFYDPELGLFQTPDPQAEFSSPYLYAGGNPVNGVDPDGEGILGFLAAVLGPILLGATSTAFLSGVTALIAGGDFLEAACRAFVAGAIGAGIGTLLGGLNVAFQYVVGGAEFIEAGGALQAVIEVARRASFTASITNSATTVADAAGASSDLVAAIGFVTPLLASYAYDNYIIKESGLGQGGGGSQRQMAKEGGVQNVNTSQGHTTVTSEAAAGTGWEEATDTIVKHNLAQDTPEATGSLLRDKVAGLNAILNNEDHFGRLPQSLAGIDDTVSRAAIEAAKQGDASIYASAVFGQTHYIQDHLTLGHMVPGTNLFKGPIGAPARFVIHQVFGGEVAFRQAQIRATRSFLLRHPNGQVI